MTWTPVQTPYRAYDPTILSWGEASTLATCEQRWHYEFPQGRRAAPTEPLVLGVLLHETLGAWWATGRLHPAAEVCPDHLRPYTDRTIFERADRIGARYEATWALIRANHTVKVLATELALRVPGDPFGIPGITITAHIDQVLSWDDHVVLVERKTMGSWHRRDQVPRHPQEHLYAALYDAAGAPHGPTDLVLFDAVHTRNDHPCWPVWLRSTRADQNAALAWMRAVHARRAALIDGASPIRAWGMPCAWCPHRDPCHRGRSDDADNMA